MTPAARQGRAAGESPADVQAFATFRGLSALRGRRIFHPIGDAWSARWAAVAPGRTATVFAPGFEHPALVRVSRGLGLRAPLPDIFGLAIRLPSVYGEGLHQDFLLAASGRGRVGRYLLRPGRAPKGKFSSLLPYQLDGRRLVVGADVADERHVEITTAGMTSRWSPTAVVHLEERLPTAVSEELRFDPWNVGGGLHPAGVLNRLRAPAYRGSRAGSRR